MISAVEFNVKTLTRRLPWASCETHLYSVMPDAVDLGVCYRSWSTVGDTDMQL